MKLLLTAATLTLCLFAQASQTSISIPDIHEKNMWTTSNITGDTLFKNAKCVADITNINISSNNTQISFDYEIDFPKCSKFFPNTGTNPCDFPTGTVNAPLNKTSGTNNKYYTSKKGEDSKWEISFSLTQTESELLLDRVLLFKDGGFILGRCPTTDSGSCTTTCVFRSRDNIKKFSLANPHQADSQPTITHN